jgi:hypothetical protein
MSSMQLMIKADVLFITDESHRVQCCAAISPAEFLRVLLSSRVSKVFEFFCKQSMLSWDDNFSYLRH